MRKIVQVFGLVCPFTSKIRFVEIAKNANMAYESLLRAAHLFSDPISDWVNILKTKGVKPGFVLLDTKTTNGSDRKIYWEKIYGIKKEELKPILEKKNIHDSFYYTSKLKSSYIKKIKNNNIKH